MEKSGLICVKNCVVWGERCSLGYLALKSNQQVHRNKPCRGTPSNSKLIKCASLHYADCTRKIGKC